MLHQAVMTSDFRLIAHLDMDAFYASVELLRYPALRGLPLVIGGGRRTEGSSWTPLSEYVGRGVITTATYEARALGVHSGMGLMKAAKLAPEALRLPVDFDMYRHYSRLFKAAVQIHAPLMEDRGIDEIYLDLTHSDGVQADNGWALARTISQVVFESTGLTCSIGLAPNKLIAKLASDLNKPNGISQVMARDVQTVLWPLPAKRINGIGPKANQKLQQIGIHTIEQLAVTPVDVLVAQFGKSYGQWMHDAAWGRDDRPVVTHTDPKSISRESTFSRDLHVQHDKATLTGILDDLCLRLAGDCERKRVWGKTIGIKIKFDNFNTVTRDVTMPDYVRTAQDLRQGANVCLKRVRFDRKIRLLGVRLGNLLTDDQYATHQTRLAATFSNPLQSLPLFDQLP